MTRYRYRDERRTAEMLACIAGIAWGAVKTWQRIEGRPQMSADDVREAADDWLRTMDGQAADDSFVDAGAAAVLAALDRADAAIYINEV